MWIKKKKKTKSVGSDSEFAELVKSHLYLRLRSANRRQLIMPRCRLNTSGRWASSTAGPTVWNSLPDELRDPARGFGIFGQFLKTILFSLYQCIQRIRGVFFFFRSLSKT